MSATDPYGLIGQVLDGQFRIDGYVGEGGFSVVYRGTHVGLSEPIAIKCLKLPPALGSALVETFIKRFRDESRIHYRLSQGHLHIARCIASGTTVAPATSSLVPYTVLEWLEGLSLAEDFEERRARGLTGRPLSEVIKLLDSAIDALAYAHAQGVVHRDLNPGNLFLAKTSSGIKLKVLDFGVAKVLADAAIAMGPAARTLGNVRIFTPAYGAPEQFDEAVGSVGPWTDVYALALVVLEALTDRTVVEGDHIGELAAKALNPIHRPTPRALGIPVGDEVEAVLARAVALAPDQRPCDAGELWGMLKHAIAVDEASAQARLRGHPSRPPEPAVALAAPQGAQGFGGTLRMSNAPRGGIPIGGMKAFAPPTIDPESAEAGTRRSRPDDGSAALTPVSVGPRLRVPSMRAWVVIAVVLAVLVLGVVAAAWFLASTAHPAASASIAAELA